SLRRSLLTMDSLRIFAGIVFAVSIFLLVDSWVREQQKPAAQTGPGVTQKGDSGLPSPTTGLGANSASPQQQATPSKLLRGERIRISTDVLVAEIDTIGADLRRLELSKYRDTFDKNLNFVLLQENERNTYVTQSGLFSDKLPKLPNHSSGFKAEQASYD